MKSPHDQRPDDQAREDTEKFIAKYAGRPSTSAKGRAPRKARASTGAAKARGSRPRATK
jgi:myo-inositol-1-phosphate synthase